MTMTAELITAKANQAFDDIKNGDFSQAKPVLRDIIGQSINTELETRDFDKIRCMVPEIPNED